MKIIRIGMGPFNVNCYALIEGKEAVIIDPSVNSLELTHILKGCTLKYILNTHGHFDHIGGNTFLKNGTNAPIVIHEKDAHMLTNPEANLSNVFLGSVISIPAEIIIHEEEFTFNLGKYEFITMMVPGHSPGCVAFYCAEKKALFSGDFIFSNTIGRTDLPGGNMKQMKNSIKRIITLPDDTNVYPGHEEPFKLSEFKDIHKTFLNHNE